MTLLCNATSYKFITFCEEVNRPILRSDQRLLINCTYREHWKEKKYSHFIQNTNITQNAKVGTGSLVGKQVRPSHREFRVNGMRFDSQLLTKIWRSCDMLMANEWGYVA